MNIRGDTFDFVTGTIHVGECAIKRTKYEGCLAALVRLDATLGHLVQAYMEQVTAQKMCPDPAALMFWYSFAIEQTTSR